MKGEISYYKILGVDENASNHELRKAFCKLSIELHPDTTSLEIDEAKSKFQEVLEAYENLNNSNLRKIYNDKLKKKFDEKKDLLQDLSDLSEKNQDLLHQKELSLAVLMEKNENLISREKSLADNIEKLEFDKQRVFDRSLLQKKDLQRNEEEMKELHLLKEKNIQYKIFNSSIE